MESIRVFFNETSDAIRSYTWKELFAFVPFLWILVLFLIPLKKIDTRHEVTFTLFLVVFVSICLTTVIILPSVIYKEPLEPQKLMDYIFLFAAIALWRWSRASNKQNIFVIKEIK